jgi:DNA gyrase subunit A
MLYYYLEHQKEVLTRRTRFELEKAEARAHILEGYQIALDHIDAVIALIRRSRNDEAARTGLMQTFNLSEKQAQAILDMRLRRLTGLEREKIDAELAELELVIARLLAVLADEKLLLNIIREELLMIKEKYSDERRTEIMAAVGELDLEDLIADEDVIVTITHQGYIKRLSVDTYRSQRRGGRGITAMGTKEEDFVEHLFITSTHNYLLVLTNRGLVYRTKIYEIPEASRQARGTPIVNVMPLEPGESISAVISLREFAEDEYLFLTTEQGVAKKTALAEYNSIKANGLIGITLREDDQLISAKLVTDEDEAIIGTRKGQAIRFSTKDVRPMGRTAQGVRGINLGKSDQVIGMDLVRENADLLIVTENGYGKRTPIAEYRGQNRGGKGIQTVRANKRNGKVVGIKMVRADDDVMIITAEGIIIRMAVHDISQMGRSTQGVTLIRLEEHDKVVALARVAQKVEQ